MPEGDTIYRAAQTLQRALGGEVVTGFRSVYPAVTRVDIDTPVSGRTIDAIRAVGKHLLITFSGDLILHTHMRMHGAWHLYRPLERWHRPSADMRIVIDTRRFVAVAFLVPVAAWLTAATLAQHPVIAALGPDLTDPAFDAADVVRRARTRTGQTIEDTLLDQRVVAGIGNVFKSEVLFEGGVHPFQPTTEVPDETLARLLVVAQRQMRMSIMPAAASLSPARGRRTTGRLDPRESLWVYGRGGRPCRRCGTPIRSRQSGADARLTYWCPQCQPEGR